jgi:hypothetical protein
MAIGPLKCRRCERIAAHHDRERDQDLDVVLVHRLHQQEAQVADDQAEQHAAARLEQEEFARMRERERLRAGRGGQ